MIQPTEEKIYRVCVTSPAGCDGVLVMCFGTEEIDGAVESMYTSIDALPLWIQERLALLSMVSYTPPTEHIEGVGRRITKDTFWVCGALS